MVGAAPWKYEFADLGS